jgi:hypothetical protein
MSELIFRLLVTQEVVSGVATRDEGLGRTASGLDLRLVYPAFREELTGTLLHRLLTHPRCELSSLFFFRERGFGGPF